MDHPSSFSRQSTNRLSRSGSPVGQGHGGDDSRGGGCRVEPNDGSLRRTGWAASASKPLPTTPSRGGPLLARLYDLWAAADRTRFCRASASISTRRNRDRSDNDSGSRARCTRAGCLDDSPATEECSTFKPAVFFRNSSPASLGFRLRQQGHRVPTTRPATSRTTAVPGLPRHKLWKSALTTKAAQRDDLLLPSEGRSKE